MYAIMPQAVIPSRAAFSMPIPDQKTSLGFLAALHHFFSRGILFHRDGYNGSVVILELVP